MKKEELSVGFISFITIITCIISFAIGFIIPDVYKMFINRPLNFETNYYLRTIPESMLNEYAEDGGSVHVVSDLRFDGYDWSSGYYRSSDNNIYVRRDVGEYDTVEQVLAHEMAHYMWFKQGVDKEAYEKLTSQEYSKSQYFKYLDPNGNHYYADPVELFAQQSSLYLLSQPHEGYEGDRDSTILWILERTFCPETCKFIENYYSVYYN